MAERYLRQKKKRYTENVIVESFARLTRSQSTGDMLNFDSSPSLPSLLDVSVSAPVDLSAKLPPLPGTVPIIPIQSSVSAPLADIYKNSGLDQFEAYLASRQGTQLHDNGEATPNIGGRESGSNSTVPILPTNLDLPYSRSSDLHSADYLGSSHNRLEYAASAPAEVSQFNRPIHSTPQSQLPQFELQYTPNNAQITSSIILGGQFQYKPATGSSAAPLSSISLPHPTTVGPFPVLPDNAVPNPTNREQPSSSSSSSSSSTGSNVTATSVPSNNLRGSSASPSSSTHQSSSSSSSSASQERLLGLEPFSKIFNEFYRVGFEEEFRDIRSMLGNSTFTVKSVRALNYPSIPMRFASVVRQVYGNTPSEIFSLISLAPPNQFLPQLFQDNDVILPHELTQFTSDTSALNDKPRRFIVVCDVIGQYAKPKDKEEKLFELDHSCLLHPCYLVELTWPPGTQVVD